MSGLAAKVWKSSTLQAAHVMPLSSFFLQATAAAASAAHSAIVLRDVFIILLFLKMVNTTFSVYFEMSLQARHDGGTNLSSTRAS
jgi:hypothetical protein